MLFMSARSGGWVRKRNSVALAVFIFCTMDIDRSAFAAALPKLKVMLCCLTSYPPFLLGIRSVVRCSLLVLQITGYSNLSVTLRVHGCMLEWQAG